MVHRDKLQGRQIPNISYFSLAWRGANMICLVKKAKGRQDSESNVMLPLVALFYVIEYKVILSAFFRWPLGSLVHVLVRQGAWFELSKLSRQQWPLYHCKCVPSIFTILEGIKFLTGKSIASSCFRLRYI